MKNIYSKLFLMLFMLSVVSAYVSAQRDILFIGREATPDGFAMDRDCLDSLESWGYTVTYIANSDYGSATADVYSGHDGVFISETVNSGDMVNFGVRDNYPLPIVNLEGYTPRTNRWAWLSDDATDFHQGADASGTEEEKVIIIKDNSHYITSIFDVNEEVTWSNATGADLAEVTAVSIKEATMVYSAKLAKNKAIAAEADFWTMITIDESAAMPNRHFLWGMVGAGINGVSQTEHLGTQNFFTIIKRAMEWALDLMPSAVDDHKLENARLVAFPNPASDRATIRFNTSVSANAQVTLHNITGQQLEVLYNKDTATGNNFIFLDATRHTPGVYLIRLEVGEDIHLTKLIIN
jgi:hypothetical protein